MDRKRSGFQDMAAEGLITLDELTEALLEEVEQTVEYVLGDDATRGDSMIR